MITIFDGMKEEDNEPLSIASFQIKDRKVERFVGTWFMAVVSRYGVITFDRRENGNGIVIEAILGDEVVAFLILVGNAETLRVFGV